MSDSIKRAICGIIASFMLVPCYAGAAHKPVYATDTDVTPTSGDPMRYIGSEQVKAIMKNTVMVQPNAEYAYVYGTREPVSEDGSGYVYHDESKVYVPNDFLKKTFPGSITGNEEYSEINDFAGRNGLFVSRHGETVYISKGYDVKTDIPQLMDRLFGIYISPNGSGAGSFRSPMGDIMQTRGLIAQIRKKVGLPDGGLTVYMREGTYSIKDTIGFSGDDGGMNGAPVTYKAYNHEKVAFNGGISVMGRDFMAIENNSIKKRLPDPDNVVYADLSAQLSGFNSSFKEDDPATWNVNYKGENLTVCRWPNNSFALTGEILEADQDNWRTKGFRFVVDDTRIKNWTKEEDPRIFGYFAVRWAGEFRKIADVRVSDLSIGSDRGAERGILSGKEYYVYNMLSELDTGGEFYFDKKNNILYLFPVEGDVKNTEFLNNSVQFALLSTTMFSLRDCHDLTFDGIVFENSLGRIIEMNEGCTNITIKGCTFKNVTDGIIQKGFNNKITGCDFYGIASNPVTMMGGDRNTLTPSGSVIQNCSFRDYNTIQRTNNGAIRVEGCGELITHNEIVGGPHTAVVLSGNDNIIEYNELYDNLQDQAEDAGVVYGGRSLADQNDVVRYNYFHDIPPSMGVIYYDDTLSNMHSQTNVFINTGSAMIMHGGVNNSMNDCLVINGKGCGGSVITDGNAARFWDSSTATSFAANTFLWKAMDYPYKSKPWQKYSEIFKHIDAHLDMKVVPPYDSEFIGNTFVNLAKTENSTDGVEAIGPNVAPYVIVKDNTLISKEDAKDFVIPERYQEIIDNAGIYVDEDRTHLDYLGSFNLVAPYNKSQEIEASSVTFTWGSAENASRYLFTLATDPEFKNIISNKYVAQNNVTINRLNYNKTRYYWKVKAIGKDTNSMLTDEPVKSNQEYYSFTTKQKELLNKEKLMDLISQCRFRMESVNEGEAPGDYKAGTKQTMEELLTSYENRANSPTATQRNINEMSQELSYSFNILMANRYPEYCDMFKLLSSPANWNITPNQYFMSPGYLKHTTSSMSIFGTSEKMPMHQVLRFNAKIDALNAGMVAFGIRAQASPTAVAWQGNDQYLIVLKEATLEFQKFGPGESVFVEYPNDCIKPGQTHEFEISAINQDDGSVKTTMKVDGKLIIEYSDNDEPIMQPGYFEVYGPAQNYSIELTAPEEQED